MYFLLTHFALFFFFLLSRCGPCQRIAPLFDKLSNDYASKGVKFFKVDVDKCSGTQGMFSVNAMPTFLFFKKGQIVGRIQGADPNSLTEKLREFVGANDAIAVAAKNSPVPGYLDLTNFINKAGSECLNASDEHNLDRALLPGSAFYMESDCDEQIIMNLAFQQPMRVHSMRILAPAENGPKIVKLFINVPRTPDFDSAMGMEAIQKFEIESDDLVKGNPIALRFVKFQNVQNICVSF